jgi:hypothetical protein
LSDLDKWAETPDNELYEIAKDWASRFSLKKLKALQESYNIYSGSPLTENNIHGLQNMWQCATYAVDIKEFGVR